MAHNHGFRCGFFQSTVDMKNVFFFQEYLSIECKTDKMLRFVFYYKIHISYIIYYVFGRVDVPSTNTLLLNSVVV